MDTKPNSILEYIPHDILYLSRRLFYKKYTNESVFELLTHYSDESFISLQNCLTSGTFPHIVISSLTNKATVTL